MKEQSASGILGTSIEKIKDLVDVSTIIGDPIKISETLQIIPVSKVTYGFASGGSDFPSKSNAELFGGESSDSLAVHCEIYGVCCGHNFEAVLFKLQQFLRGYCLHLGHDEIGLFLANNAFEGVGVEH